MRILFLTQIVPYPPDAGPKIKTWNVLRYLAKEGHSITLVSFVREEEVGRLRYLSDLCNEIYSVPIKRSRIKDFAYLLRSFLSGRPFLIERDDLKEMRILVNRLLASNQYDFLHADQLTMAQFALANSSANFDHRSSAPTINDSHSPTTLIFDAHNAVWTIVERMTHRVHPFLRPIVKIESRRIKMYEGMIINNFDHTLAVTENDRKDLLFAAGLYSSKDNLMKEDHYAVKNWVSEKVSVIPIAVDTSSLLPIYRDPNSCNILTLGTLHYPPNADGIRWFVREVLPLIRQQIPEVTLTIVGKNPPPDFKNFEKEFDGSVIITGYVPDLNPYFQNSAISVIPVLAGGGMRVRILEAFARAMPVITTTIGLEGIDATDNTDVLIRDTPVGFANAVIELIKNKELQSTLAANGRRLAERRYDWKVVLNQLDSIYNHKNIDSVI